MTVTTAMIDAGLVVTLPGSAPDPDASVAALEFDQPVQIGTLPELNMKQF